MGTDGLDAPGEASAAASAQGVARTGWISVVGIDGSRSRSPTSPLRSATSAATESDASASARVAGPSRGMRAARTIRILSPAAPTKESDLGGLPRFSRVLTGHAPPRVSVPPWRISSWALSASPPVAASGRHRSSYFRGGRRDSSERSRGRQSSLLRLPIRGTAGDLAPRSGHVRHGPDGMPAPIPEDMMRTRSSLTLPPRPVTVAANARAVTVSTPNPPACESGRTREPQVHRRGPPPARYRKLGGPLHPVPRDSRPTSRRPRRGIDGLEVLDWSSYT